MRLEINRDNEFQKRRTTSFSNTVNFVIGKQISRMDLKRRMRNRHVQDSRETKVHSQKTRPIQKDLCNKIKITDDLEPPAVEPLPVCPLCSSEMTAALLRRDGFQILGPSVWRAAAPPLVPAAEGELRSSGF